MKYTIDSRTVAKGDIFIPVKGNHFDGHDFVAEVERKGAQVLDVDLAQFAASHRRKFDIPVIAITGSAGKTTFKDLLAHLLAAKYRVVKNSENQNNEIGVPLTLLKIDEQTDIAVIEMGARKLGDIDYLAKLVNPTVVYITNIGEAHLELFGSLANTLKAKSEIITGDSRVFLNTEQSSSKYLLARVRELGADVSEFSEKVVLNQNQAGAVAIAKYFELSDQQIEEALASFVISSQRLKCLKTKIENQVLLDDSYNSNPTALAYALALLQRDYPHQKKLFVLGDMLELGEDSPNFHKMLEIEKDVILFTLGDDSRYFSGGSLHQHFENKADLLAAVLAMQESVDLIFVKGSRSLALETIVKHLKVEDI